MTFENARNPDNEWVKETITESELFNEANNGNATQTPPPQANTSSEQNTGYTPPRNDQQGQQQSYNQPPPENDFNFGNFIDEEVAVELIDTAIPALASMLLKLLGGIKVPANKLKASESQKTLLKKPMKAALAASNIKVTNPFEALAIGIICAYGSKIVEVAFDPDVKRTTKKEEGFAPYEEIKDLNNFVQEQTEKKERRGRPRKNPLP